MSADDTARDRDDDPNGIAFDRDPMILQEFFDRFAAGLDCLVSHGFHLPVRVDVPVSLPGTSRRGLMGVVRSSAADAVLKRPRPSAGELGASDLSSTPGLEMATPIDGTFLSADSPNVDIFDYASVPVTPSLIPRDAAALSDNAVLS